MSHNTNHRIPRVLSIAGTDPTGGAGIHADLKSIAANGGYGMAVVTALVAQNTTGVRDIHVPPVEFVQQQLTAVSDDVTIDAVKIGMLFNTPLIDTVGTWLQEVTPPLVVLDPVMVAASGDRLLDADAEQSLRDLVGRADLVTPNLPELAVLLGRREARSWAEAVEQAKELAAQHHVRVLAKGGHLAGEDAPDALIDPATDAVVEFHAPRIHTRHTHGTGCSLSSGIATQVARTGDWESAVRQTKAWLTASIQAAPDLEVGSGNGPVSHLASLWRRAGVFS